MADWQKQRREHQRLDSTKGLFTGKMVPTENAKDLLETIIHPGDRVCLEGYNQNQADFLAEQLASVDPARGGSRRSHALPARPEAGGADPGDVRRQDGA
jgi:malonate decarboxylase alpha subunit